MLCEKKIKSAVISPLKKGCISPTGSVKTPNNSPTPIRICIILIMGKINFDFILIDLRLISY
jgi:hypothetical protein